MVVLTAYATVQPDKVAAALDACRLVHSQSVGEPGCERYDYFQSPDRPNEIVFVEEWTTIEHLNTHFQQAAFNAFMATMSELLAKPAEIRMFDASKID